MSSILHEDTFHGTKKGMRRKTVSKRRAYVNTPRQLNTKKQKVIDELDNFIYNMERTDGFEKNKPIAMQEIVIGGLKHITRLVNDI